MSSTQNISSTFKMLPYAVTIGAALLVGCLAGVGMSILAGWAATDSGAILRSVVLALAAWIVGAAFGGVVLLGATRGRIENLGFGVLGASMARMLIALMLALLMYFVAAPDGRSFFVTVLFAGVLALLAEAAWAVRTLASLGAGLVPASANKHPSTAAAGPQDGDYR